MIQHTVIGSARRRVAIVSLVFMLAGSSRFPARAADEPPGTAAVDPAKQAVEARLLEKAAENVEQHRKALVSVRVETAEGQPVADAQVEVRQTTHEFLFGCIIFDLVWQRDAYQPDLFRRRFQELFNFAVFPFYWKSYEPKPGQPRREEAVAVARWCRENGITTKGHPLVWTHPAGVPDWVKELSAAESEKRLLARVTREVGGLAGVIDIWDVVNEPIHTRTWTNVSASDYGREPIDKIADYVDKAFQAAHRANPKADLILNEFYTIAKPEDRERFYRLVQELKRRNTPVSGLGIQAHEPRQDWYPPEETWATFERLAGLGYPLHVTEFIPQSGGKEITGGWRSGKWTQQSQAEFAEQIYRLSFGHPAVASVNWWGFSDRRIWQPGGGLVDEEYEPKPVYTRLKRLIHDQWKTRLDTTTDEQGGITFRGFHGRYAVRVKAPGKEVHSFEAVLRKDQDNKWTFKLSP